MSVLPVRLGCALVLALWGVSVSNVKAGTPPDSGSEQGLLAEHSACGLATSQEPAFGNSGLVCECQAPGVSEWCITNCMWLQLTAGAVFSPTRGIGPHDEPTLNLAPLDVRLGLMLNEPHPQRHWFSGVFDIIVEFTTEPVFTGFGNIVVGPAALLRYDFVRPGWGLIPYLQGGGGIVYNDCYHDSHQNAVGQSVEFLLRVDVGVHYPLGPKWSIDAEFNFLHISNADLAVRNAGVNALGASIGLTYFFRK
jgi:lipid A 3-O-deacylase